MSRRCRSGKVRFPSEHAAQVVLIGAVIKNNRGARQRREKRAYECQLCRGWHLTSKTERRPAAPVGPPHCSECAHDMELCHGCPCHTEGD